MGVSHDFQSICMYMCVAWQQLYCQPASEIHIANVLSATFRVRRTSHAHVLSCLRSCVGCLLAGPKPVSKPGFRYLNTRCLAHPCCDAVWCRSAPLTSILVFETIIEPFLLCCWILGGLSTDYPRDAPAFSSIL